MVLYTPKMHWRYESRTNYVYKKQELNKQSIFQNKILKVRVAKYEKLKHFNMKKIDSMLPVFSVSNIDLSDFHFHFLHITVTCFITSNLFYSRSFCSLRCWAQSSYRKNEAALHITNIGQGSTFVNLVSAKYVQARFPLHSLDFSC